MSKTVVLLGDTHLPRFGTRLPAALVAGLATADLILHVGDITESFVLDLLADFAPTHAVAGNNDPSDLAQRLGFVRTVQVEGLRLGMTHGHRGPGRTTPERARRTFVTADPTPDAICFGHSHQPLVEHQDGLWLLNPGSPTDRRRQPAFSYLRLEVDGSELRPELITYYDRAPAASS
ncbi:MAG: metallophosphoesterase [Chloroflexota bacterium]|nr:metallophosphoesterase [Chloroflexota bacterium]